LPFVDSTLTDDEKTVNKTLAVVHAAFTLEKYRLPTQVCLQMTEEDA